MGSVIVAIVLMVFVLPADVGAKSGYQVYPGGTQIVLPVQKAAGYVMSVSANMRQRVLFKFDSPSLDIELSTKGNVSGQRIEADFGALGRINVVLHLVGYPSDPRHRGRCKGYAPRYYEGSYSGSIEFADLGLDTSQVSIKSGRVYLTHRFRQVCRRQSIRPELNEKNMKDEIGVLKVNGQAEGRAVLLQALEFTPWGRPARSQGYLSAAVFEILEGVRITRRMETPTNRNSFVLSRPGDIPETAEVKLPEPFSGHAFYSSNPGTFPSWTGNLSVDFPVIGRMPLTGLGFTAMLCRGFSVAMLKSCSSTAPV